MRQFIRDSYAERSWTRISILVLGMTNVLLAGAVFLAPGSIEISSDGGTFVDWIAAVGTWVIGIGAIRFAASDHALKISERRERRLVELNNDLEVVQSVGRAAEGGSAELAEIIEGLNKELPQALITGMRNSVSLSQLQGALYFLSWNQAQLRLLGRGSATLAKELEAEGRRIRLVVDRLLAGQNFDVLLQSVGDLIERIERLRKHLSVLVELAAQDAQPTERNIQRLKDEL